MTYDNDKAKLEDRIRELEYILDNRERLNIPDVRKTFFYNVLKERGKND